MKAQEYLASVGACDEARRWVGNKSLREAWDTCPRADWMLWLLARRAPLTQVQAVTLACAFARTALSHVPDGESRPLRAIEAAEAWLRTPNLDTANAARAAANAAYAAARAAANAAYAAAYAAARAAANAAYAAAYAADAANAAYAAAYAANAACAACAARARAAAPACAGTATAAAAAYAVCADIIRQHIPCPVRR